MNPLETHKKGLAALRSGACGKSKLLRCRYLLMFGTVLLAAGFFWLMRSTPSASGLPEIPVSELVVKEGRVVEKGGADNFTGFMTEFYPNGSLKSRSQIFEGLLHGRSEGWHPNGELEIREHFKHGISHGLRTKWHDTGIKLSEATIEEGQMHGLFRRWHENGAPAEEIQMENGSPEGLSLAFYPSGSIKARATLQSGIITDQKFWNEGEATDHATAFRGRWQ
jgi:antitoxin component YwqK of YwqJK toxin-antitoxin module